MFWSDPTVDLQVIIYASLVALAISAGLYIFTRKIFLALIVFSILANIVFYGNSGSRLFDIYGIKWLVIFSLDYWPYLNIALFIVLIINLIKNKNAKTK